MIKAVATQPNPTRPCPLPFAGEGFLPAGMNPEHLTFNPSRGIAVGMAGTFRDIDPDEAIRSRENVSGAIDSAAQSVGISARHG